MAGFERSSEGQITVAPKYDVESTKTVGLVQQIIAEGERPVCDVFWNNEIMHTVRLQKLGLLKKHSWDIETDYPSDMVSSDGTWVGFAARARVLLINKELLKDPAEYPRSVAELSDPKWQKNCAMARPLFGTTATHFAVLRERDGREPTLDFLRAVKSNALVLSGNKQVALAVSAGNVAWGLTDTDDAIIEKDLGHPVEIVFPDQQPEQPGTLRIPNTVAILNNAPHPVSAGKLADFLFRWQTEDRLAMGDSSQMPLSRQSKFPPRVLPQDPVRWMRVDFEAAADDWEEWSKTVREILDK